MSALSNFGTARFGTGGNYPKNFKIKGDDKNPDAVNKTVFRVLPPMHGQVGNDRGWKLFTKIHYGYKGNDPKDPTKPRARPFVCPREKDFRTDMIKVDCGECRKIETMKEREEKVKREVENKTDKEKAARLGPLKEWLKTHNLQAKWKMNVFDVDNNVGDILLSHRTMKDLDLLFKELSDGGYDPLHPEQGVWVEVTRKGSGFKDPDKVAAVKTKIKVEGVGDAEVVKPAPMTEALANAAWNTCRDLADPTPAVVLSAEQIELLASCDGSPDEVDRIFAMSQKAAATAARSPQRQAAPAPAPLPKTFRDEPEEDANVVLEEVAAAPMEEETPAAPIEEDEETALERQLAEARARKAATKAAASAPKPQTPAKPVPTAAAAKAPTKPVSEMNDEEFGELFPELNGVQ